MLLTAALLAAAQAGTATASPDYSKPSNWLCLPGRADICSTPLPTTALNPNGYGSTGQSPVTKDAAIDCFYVYPTISRDRGVNSDLTPGDGEEKAAVATQFARFAGACRTFAPVYRSMTVGLITAVAAGADFKAPFATAYGDVRAAWKEYLAKYNKGRPFVLIGHSQGSWMLQTLIAKEIEGKPEAKRMKLAIIPGFNVLVPQGKLTGGTFKSTPVCSRAGQTGCVMTWVSYREKNVPPPGAMFGYADKPGMTVACTNPARPGATGWSASTAIGLLARRCRCPADRSIGRPKARRQRPSSAPTAWYRRDVSMKARAAIFRSEPMPIPTTNAPIASAEKSARWAFSSPAGACTSPT